MQLLVHDKSISLPGFLLAEIRKALLLLNLRVGLECSSVVELLQGTMFNTQHHKNKKTTKSYKSYKPPMTDKS